MSKSDSISNEKETNNRNIIIRKKKNNKNNNSNNKNDKNSIEILDINTSNSLTEGKKTMIYSENLNYFLCDEFENEKNKEINISNLSMSKSEISNLRNDNKRKNKYKKKLNILMK